MGWAVAGLVRNQRAAAGRLVGVLRWTAQAIAFAALQGLAGAVVAAWPGALDGAGRQ